MPPPRREIRRERSFQPARNKADLSPGLSHSARTVCSRRCLPHLCPGDRHMILLGSSPRMSLTPGQGLEESLLLALARAVLSLFLVFHSQLRPPSATALPTPCVPSRAQAFRLPAPRNLGLHIDANIRGGACLSGPQERTLLFTGRGQASSHPTSSQNYQDATST